MGDRSEGTSQTTTGPCALRPTGRWRIMLPNLWYDGPKSCGEATELSQLQGADVSLWPFGACCCARPFNEALAPLLFLFL